MIEKPLLDKLSDTERNEYYIRIQKYDGFWGLVLMFLWVIFGFSVTNTLFYFATNAVIVGFVVFVALVYVFIWVASSFADSWGIKKIDKEFSERVAKRIK